MAKFKHLTILNRVEIQSCLDRGFRFYEIAKQLNKDPTTIAKEVKKHLIRKETGCGGQAYNPACTFRVAMRLKYAESETALPGSHAQVAGSA